MKKVHYILFVFICFSFSIIVSIYLRQSVHSEGVGIVSVWPPVIFGIDFQKDKFIYSQEMEELVFNIGFIKIKLKSFFPYLTLVIFGKEIMISWVFYYTPFLTYYISEPLRNFKLIPESIALTFISVVILYFFSSLKLASVLFRNFIRKEIPKLFFLLFIIFSPSFYSLILQFHHLQSAIFLNLFIAFLLEGRYKISSIFGGLALYSYAPSIHLVLGAYITQIIRTKNLKAVLLSSIISLSFLIPYIIHIRLAEKMADHYQKVCKDCIFYNAYTELYNFFGQKVEGFSLDKIIPKIFQGLSQTLSSCCFVKEAFVKLKSSFSLSDIYLGYGFISQKSDLHFSSDIANIIVLAITLIFGIIFFTKSFEVIFIIVSLFLFLLLDVIIPAVPKMLYTILPVFSCLFVKVLFKIKNFAKDLWVILVLAMLLRISDVYKISDYYLPYFKEKETKDVVNFVLQNKLENEIYVFSMPIAFWYYSGAKANPPLVLLAYHRGEKEDKLKIIRFLLRKTKYVLIDARFEDMFKESARYEGIDMNILFKNQAYMVISSEK